MKNKTKLKIFIGILGFGILLIIVTIIFIQKPLVQSPSNLIINSITYNGEDITSKIDHESIVKLLNSVKCRKTFRDVSSYTQNEILVEIDTNNAGKPLHIILGNFYISYEAVGKNVCIIEGGDFILSEIISLLGRVK